EAAPATEENAEATDEEAPKAKKVPASKAKGKKAVATEDEEKMEVDELEGDDNKDGPESSKRKTTSKAKPASKSTKGAKPASSAKGAKANSRPASRAAATTAIEEDNEDAE
ncbi:hypothetical protein FRC07_001007, partial [Ceratobasidium sp. 392]